MCFTIIMSYKSLFLKKGFWKALTNTPTEVFKRTWCWFIDWSLQPPLVGKRNNLLLLHHTWQHETVVSKHCSLFIRVQIQHFLSFIWLIFLRRRNVVMINQQSVSLSSCHLNEWDIKLPVKGEKKNVVLVRRSWPEHIIGVRYIYS